MFVNKIQSYKDNFFKACQNLKFFPWVIEVFFLEFWVFWSLSFFQNVKKRGWSKGKKIQLLFHSFSAHFFTTRPTSKSCNEPLKKLPQGSMVDYLPFGPIAECKVSKNKSWFLNPESDFQEEPLGFYPRFDCQRQQKAEMW